jgi:hypothetical protein
MVVIVVLAARPALEIRRVERQGCQVGASHAPRVAAGMRFIFFSSPVFDFLQPKLPRAHRRDPFDLVVD